MDEDGVDRERILKIIKKVHGAAQFQLEGSKPQVFKLNINEPQDLLREEFLWEEFESEERDEELWEEDIDQEAWEEQNYWWNTFCRDIVGKSEVLKG